MCGDPIAPAASTTSPPAASSARTTVPPPGPLLYCTPVHNAGRSSRLWPPAVLLPDRVSEQQSVHVSTEDQLKAPGAVGERGFEVGGGR